jgi:hypothetical protein
MFHRPLLRVGRDALNFGNLEEQERKRKIPKFLKIPRIEIVIFGVLQFQWKFS